MEIQKIYGISMKINNPQGATPISPSGMVDLVPTHLRTQEELNDWEKNNITKAKQWALKKQDIVSITFIRDLHYHMFDETWKWAGIFRKVELNFGIDWILIGDVIKKSSDNVLYQR